MKSYELSVIITPVLITELIVWRLQISELVQKLYIWNWNETMILTLSTGFIQLLSFLEETDGQ